MFLILLFKLLTQFHFVSFLSISILSLLSFLNPLSSPPSLLSLLCLPKIKTSNFITFCFTNGTFFCILFHTMTFFNNAFYKLVKTKFGCLSSNLSYPEDLKKQWLHRRVGFRNFNKGGGGGGLSGLLLFKLSFCLFLYPLSAPFLNPLSSPFPHFP